jgi:hypothetical protein
VKHFTSRTSSTRCRSYGATGFFDRGAINIMLLRSMILPRWKLARSSECLIADPDAAPGTASKVEDEYENESSFEPRTLNLEPKT